MEADETNVCNAALLICPVAVFVTFFHFELIYISSECTLFLKPQCVLVVMGMLVH